MPKKEKTHLGEYIRVGFKTPMRIQQVAVAESLNPGSIYRIYAIDTHKKKHKIYEKRPSKYIHNSRMLRAKFPKTDYKVAEIKIEMQTSKIEGSNQIDAIAISDSRTSIKAIPHTIPFNSTLPLAENLGRQVNSFVSDRLPIISPDGKTLFFARKQHPQNIGEKKKDDIWFSRRQKDGTWSQAQNIGRPLNNDEHNFVFATDATGKTIYLRSGGKNGGLAVSKQRKTGWSKPKPIIIPDFQNKSEFVGYHLNVNGDVLLMSVERTGGYGERDIYVSFKKHGKWSRPKNIGNVVNTVNTENNMFIAADNRTLYFSSNGHYGYGGYDIFVTKRLDDTWTNWSEPKNLGEPFNSKKNEFNFSIPASGDYAYFSSGSIQNSDIYRIPLPDELKPDAVTFVSTRIIDSETGKPIQAKLKIEKLNNKNKGDDSESPIVSNDENIAIYAEAEGYFAQSESAGLDIEEEDGDMAPSSGKLDPIVSKLKAQLKRLSSDISDLKNRKNNPLKRDKKEKQPKKAHNQSLKDKYAATLGHKQHQSKPKKDIKKEESEDLAEHEAIAEDVKKELREELYSDVEKELRTELDDELRSKMRPEIEKEIKTELEKEYRTQNKDEIRKELKKEMEAKVKRELKNEMRRQVKEDLRREMEYAMKKKLEIEIRKELEEKMKHEKIVEKPKEKPKPEPSYVEVEKDILMIPIKEGQIISLNNVFFDANKSTLKEASNTELERVLAFLKKNPNLVVEVGGHTNGLCSHKFAAELSEDRSKAVRKFFLDHGIPENHVKYMGYGKTQPIADNKTLSGRKKNQRVELKILEIL